MCVYIYFSPNMFFNWIGKRDIIFYKFNLKKHASNKTIFDEAKRNYETW